ncbi:hypothetical protein [Methylobacterium phyllosphaerae]
MANDVTPQALRRPAYGMRGALQGQYLVTFLDGVSVGVRIYSLSRSELKRELFQPSNDRTHLGVDLCRRAGHGREGWTDDVGGHGSRLINSPNTTRTES